MPFTDLYIVYQIEVSASLRPDVDSLQRVLRLALDRYRTLLGTNLAGLKYMQRVIEDRQRESTRTGLGMPVVDSDLVLLSKKRKSTKKHQKNNKKKGNNDVNSDQF